ncbi:MAG: tetratricopeptide repeat protein [Fidelibacterota bacterium]
MTPWNVTTLYRNSKILIVLTILSAVINLQAADISTDSAKILSFANHLFATEDYLRAAIEYERYLFLTGTGNDTILFKIGLCHQLRERYDYASQAFLKITNLPGSELISSARLAYLYNQYKLENWAAIRQFGSRTDPEHYFQYLAHLHQDSSAFPSATLQSIGDDSLRQLITETEARRQKLQQKSPLLASFLSSIVPGLGKVYIQRPGDALFAFGMTGFAGIVSWQAFKADLLITGVVCSGMTLSFYLGTIYGSYIGTQLYNHTQYEKLIEQLEDLNPIEKNPYWTAWLKK